MEIGGLENQAVGGKNWIWDLDGDSRKAIAVFYNHREFIFGGQE